MELQQKYPNAKVEVWSFDEQTLEDSLTLRYRLGLKPIVRRVWAPVGERPLAVVQHRYEWLYLYGFVQPETGETEWHILPRVNIDWFNISLAGFAKSIGAGKEKIVVLVIDRAGWHMSEKVVIPEGIYLEPLPAYSPELQPAERLWALADEALVNEHFDSLEQLEKVLAQRCCVLSQMKSEISALTNYHWWPSVSPV